MNRFLIALAGLLFVSGAQAASFTDEALFQAAAPGFLQEDFDSFTVGDEISILSSLGIQFEDQGDGLPGIFDDSTGAAPTSAPNVLSNRPFGVSSTQNIRFSRVDSALITAVGFWNVTTDDTMELRFLDAADQLIEAFAIGPQPAPKFGGIVSSIGAATIEVVCIAGGNCNHGFDDLQLEVAVPIPAAAWLFGSALGFLAFIRRKAK